MEISKENFESVLKNFIEYDGQDLMNQNLKDLGIDSMASIELLLELEEVFEVALPDEILTEEILNDGNALYNAIVENSNVKS